MKAHTKGDFPSPSHIRWEIDMRETLKFLAVWLRWTCPLSSRENCSESHCMTGTSAAQSPQDVGDFPEVLCVSPVLSVTFVSWTLAPVGSADPAQGASDLFCRFRLSHNCTHSRGFVYVASWGSGGGSACWLPCSANPLSCLAPEVFPSPFHFPPSVSFFSNTHRTTSQSRLAPSSYF